MRAVLVELQDPWAIMIALAAGLLLLALAVPWSVALGATVAVLGVRLGAGLVFPPPRPTVAIPAPAVANGAGPGGALTRKELEIAQLVAEGHTNREIADKLVISERTVDNHVQHILTKLDFHRRSQIAAWWTEHQMSTRK